MLKVKRNLTTLKVPLALTFIQFTTSSNGKTKAGNLSENRRSFENEFNRNRIDLTKIQKTILGIGSSIVSLYNPRRVDMLACCAEIFCVSTLENILEDMKSNKEGYQIIRDKPSIFSENLAAKISDLSSNTFGWALGKFICDNNVDPDSEISVKFINDPELAYVMNRCRQIHDCLHVLLNIPTNRVGEITVKWIEAINLGLPTAYVAAIAGSAYVAAKDRKKFIKQYLPLAVQNGNIPTKFYNAYWERKFDCDLENFRKELGVKAIP